MSRDIDTEARRQAIRQLLMRFDIDQNYPYENKWPGYGGVPSKHLDTIYNANLPTDNIRSSETPDEYLLKLRKYL